MASQTRLPTGDGSSVLHEASAGAAWECVDDPIGSPDDDSTYAHQIGGNAASLFTFSAFSITASAVSYLRVVYRSRNLTGNSTTSRAILRVNSTSYLTTGANNTQTDSYADYTHDFLTNPDTGLAWGEADINGTGSNPLQEFGFRNQNNSASEEDRFTQVYALAEYTESGGGGNRRRRFFLGAA